MIVNVNLRSARVLALFVTLLALGCAPAWAWKPNTHIHLAEEALKDALDDGKIDIYRVDYIRHTIGEKLGSYEVDPQLLQALQIFPAQYRAGVIGPDAYPDIATGQQVIHPEASGGQSFLLGGADATLTITTDDPEMYAPVKGGGANAWLDYLWRTGQKMGPEQTAARAFVAGYLTHAAGDMFSHTLVNHHTGGEFSIQPDKRNGIRHLVLEGYIGQRTPPLKHYSGRNLREDDISITNLEDFIYRYLTFAAPGSELDKLLHSKDEKNSIPRVFSNLRVGLNRQINTYYKKISDYNADIKAKNDAADACKWDDFTCSAVALRAEALAIGAQKTVYIGSNFLKTQYKERWRDDIDKGLKELPKTSHEIAMGMFAGDAKRVEDAALRYASTHLLSMRGAPDALGLSMQHSADLYKALVPDEVIEALLPAGMRKTIEDIERAPLDVLVGQALGVSVTELIGYVKEPHKDFNKVMAGGPGQPTSLVQFNVNELKITDSGYSNPKEYFDYKKVPAAWNTVVMSKLVLLSKSGMEQLLSDLEGSPVTMHQYSNIMLGFIGSMDDDNEWHKHPSPQKMLLMYDCNAYEQLFMRQTGEHGSSSCAERTNRPATPSGHSITPGETPLELATRPDTTPSATAPNVVRPHDQAIPFGPTEAEPVNTVVLPGRPQAPVETTPAEPEIITPTQPDQPAEPAKPQEPQPQQATPPAEPAQPQQPAQPPIEGAVEGQFGQEYTLGTFKPFQITLKSAEYSVERYSFDNRVYAPAANEKMLLLRYRIRNASNEPRRYTIGHTEFTATDALGANHKNVNGAAVEGSREWVNMELQAGQAIDLYTAITVPAAQPIVRLLARRVVSSLTLDPPLVSYDLRGKIRPLPALFADPSVAHGEAALLTIAAQRDTYYPFGHFDARLENVAYHAGPIAHRAAPAGGRLFTATFTIKNMTNIPQRYAAALFDAVLIDTDGEKITLRPNSLFRATRDEVAQGELEPDEEYRVRFAFEMTANINAKTLTIWERFDGKVSRSYVFDVSNAQ